MELETRTDASGSCCKNGSLIGGESLAIMRAGTPFEAVQYSAGPGVGFSTTTYQSTEREHIGLRIRKVMGELLISIRPQEARVGACRFRLATRQVEFMNGRSSLKLVDRQARPNC
jgi:hypothetical protein